MYKLMSFALSIALVSGSTYKVGIDTGASVQQLRRKVNDVTGWRCVARLISASGAALEPASAPICDFGIEDGSVLCLVGRKVQIYSNRRAFAALKEDGSVVTWGPAADGGDCTEVQEQLAENAYQVYPNDGDESDLDGGAFAALKWNGAVVTWGDAEGGGDSTAVQDQLARRCRAHLF